MSAIFKIFLFPFYFLTNSVIRVAGLCNRDILPNFHYRDDALDLWSAVNTYVGETLKVYYKCDEVKCL